MGIVSYFTESSKIEKILLWSIVFIPFSVLYDLVFGGSHEIIHDQALFKTLVWFSLFTILDIIAVARNK